MNKKGFTLIELLAVIVILSLIIVIVATNGFGAFDKSKEKINELAYKEIEEAASVLMAEIEYCTDTDEELLNLSSELAIANNLPLSGKAHIECIDYKRSAIETGVTIPVDYLIKKEYITGINAKEFYKSNPSIECQGYFQLEDNSNINSKIIKTTVCCNNNCDVNGDKTIEHTTTTTNTTTAITTTTQVVTPQNTLKETVLNDTRITKNNTQPTFTGVETNEVGMYKAPDDYGDSWYFRGKQSYNYVNFAGFTWRIVRINGDGSIRLILDGTLDKVKHESEETYVYQNEKLLALDNNGQVPFNTKYGDNAYVGYMYGNFTGNSNSYDNAHKNDNDSTIKKYIDVFYEEYLKCYEDDLADTLFCGDKTLSSNYSITNSGFGKVATDYAAFERLISGAAPPTLECASGANNTYSRYTSNSTITIKGVKLNSDLTYPIALLSADELVMAGGYWGTYNRSYYLHNAYATLYFYWWTMSPDDFRSSGTYSFYSSVGGYSLRITYTHRDNYGVRPVINLKADTIISGGDGTQGSPYTIKEIS